MSLYYSDGSNKKGTASLHTSFSSTKQKVKEFYYSNGSNKLPVWMNANGSWDFFVYTYINNTYQLYVVNSGTGKAKLIGNSQPPQQTYLDGYATSKNYTESYFYDNNGVLKRTATTGSFDLSGGDLPVSLKSNFYITRKSDSNSVGKSTYYAYNLTTDANIISVSAMFGATAILNSDKIMITSGGTSSGSTNFDQPYTVGGPSYTGGRLSNSFLKYVTLPNNYGVAAYRDGVNAVTSNSSFYIFKMNANGTAYESKYSTTIRGSLKQCLAMDDCLLIFNTRTVEKPPGVTTPYYYNSFMTKINYDGYTVEASELNIENIIGVNSTAPHQRLTYVCVGPGLFTGFNATTKSFETFSIKGTNIEFVSSVPIENTDLSVSVNNPVNAGYIGAFY